MFCQGDRAEAEAALEEPRSSLPFPLLLGVDDAIFRAYGVQTANASCGVSTVTVSLRPNGHVLDILSGDAQATGALGILTRSRDTDGVRVNASHPPVLIVPDVLSRADCQDLISIYESSDVPVVHFSEVVRADQDLKAQNPDYGRRDRLDPLLNTHGIRESVSRKLRRRLLPDVKKAFQYEVKTFEGFSLQREVAGVVRREWDDRVLVFHPG